MSQTVIKPALPRQQESGFVLVAVLALLVVLTLLASAVAVASMRAVSDAQTDLDAFDGELDTISTRDTVLFMFSTQRLTLGGLTVDDAKATPGPAADDEDIEGLAVMPVGNEIRLDNTTYAGIGNAHFSLQDGRGLLNPNMTTDFMRHSLYAQQKIPAEDWAGMDAKRLDYQDPDSLNRLGGAEAKEYTAAKLPIPSNRAVATPLEYRRILGWDKMLETMDDDQLLGMMSVDRNISINLNSAPASVLAMIPGMDAAQAERLVALRTQAPFVSLGQIRQTFTISPIADEAMTLFSSNSGNLSLWDKRQGRQRLLHWTMTPYDYGGRPWRINYEVTLPRGQQPDPDVVQPPASPFFTTQDQAGA